MDLILILLTVLQQQQVLQQPQVLLKNPIAAKLLLSIMNMMDASLEIGSQQHPVQWKMMEAFDQFQKVEIWFQYSSRKVKGRGKESQRQSKKLFLLFPKKK